MMLKLKKLKLSDKYRNYYRSIKVEDEVITTMWSIVKEYIPAKERQEVADQVVQFMIDMDMPDSEFKSIISHCEYFEEAANELLHEEEDDHYDWEE